MQVGRETPGRDGVLANSAFKEVSRYRRFGKADESRTRLECSRLRDQPGDARHISVVVALLRLELGDSESDEVAHPLEDGRTNGAEPVERMGGA
jgi:hypothetical protein